VIKGVSVTGWTNTYYTGTSPGYNFVYNATNAVDGTVKNGGGGAVALHTGSGVSGGAILGASPDGGNFIGADGVYQSSAITQTINNLTAGDTYQVGFWYAGAQQSGYDGATTEGWQVSLGSSTGTTTILNNQSHGFTGWYYAMFNFAATSSSEVLSFLALGTPSGEPPFALLDGVTMNDASVPEPSTILLLGLGLIGLGAVKLRRRARVALV
jgi:hypothetical protein